MTDEEIKYLSRSECATLLHSDKGYGGLSSAEFWEEGYKKGLTEGRKETKTEWQNCFLSCSSPYCRKYFENVAIEGCLGNMSKREQELYV